jgi:thiazole synthase ThiGH ThiG subunit
MQVEQGELGSTGAITATVISIANVPIGVELAFYIKVVSGSLKIGEGSVNASAYAFTSADTVLPIFCKNGELYVQQAAVGDTWVMTAGPA